MSADAEVAVRLDRDAELMRRLLLELDVDAVRPVPDGLAVVLASTPAGLRGVAGTIGVWVDEHGDDLGAVTLVLDGEDLVVTGRLTDDQRRAVDRWIARRPGG
jgi:hypothetical protein